MVWHGAKRPRLEVVQVRAQCGIQLQLPATLPPPTTKADSFTGSLSCAHPLPHMSEKVTLTSSYLLLKPLTSSLNLEVRS